MGRVHDRGPGPPPHGLRHRAGPPLPDPVRERRGRHRLPARPRDRGRQARRHDGRRRREVRRLADHLRALLGRGPLGGAVLRGARGQRRLADHRHAVAVARARAAHRPRLRPDVLVRRDGRVGAAARTRPSCSRSCSTTPWPGTQPEARWLRGGFWRNFQVKYREINDLHKQMLRTSRKVAAMPEGPERTSALDHLHRGQSNDCYWHGLFGGIYICHMRLATYEHLIAAEDAADSAARHVARRRAPGPRHGRPRRGPARGRRAGRHGQALGGRRHRRLGHPGRAPRADGRAAPPSRGVPRDPASPRGEGSRRRRRHRRTRRRRGHVDPRHRHGQGGGPGGPPPLRRPRATLGPRPVPGARRRPPRPSRRPPRRSWATSGTASGRWTTSRPGRSRSRAPAPPWASPSWCPRRSASRAGAWTRSSSSSWSCTTGAPSPSRRAWAWSSRCTSSAAAATRRPGTTSAARARPTTGREQAAGVEAIGYGNDWVGIAVEARPQPAGRRLVEPDRDGLQFRIGLRARLPGQYPAAVLARQDRARRDPPVRRQPASGRGAGPCPEERARP